MVRVSDGTLSSDQALSVSVSDVSESPGKQPGNAPPGNAPSGNPPDMVWLTGTPGADTFTALRGNERIDALGDIDTIVFDFKLTEAHVSHAGNQVIKNGFDYVYYLQHNPDVAAAGIDPLQHFETCGWMEGRNPNALFDVNGYLANYADVKAAGINPLDHYDQSGWHEGRSPSLNFGTTDYLGHYPDVAAAAIDPLTHFLATGIHEGRSAFAEGVWG